jgi:hypothetical protein
MGDAAGAVDDDGEVLEAVRRYRVCLPRHTRIPPPCTGTAKNQSVAHRRRGGRRSEGSPMGHRRLGRGERSIDGYVSKPAALASMHC